MKAQMEKLCFVSPGFGTEPKAKLASMLADLTPGDLDYVLFTNGGVPLPVLTSLPLVRLPTVWSAALSAACCFLCLVSSGISHPHFITK
jgi:hypothetical protein